MKVNHLAVISYTHLFILNFSSGDKAISYDPEVPGGGRSSDSRACGAGVGSRSVKALRPAGV